MLNDVEFREVQEVAIVDKVKIVACDGKSKFLPFIPYNEFPTLVIKNYRFFSSPRRGCCSKTIIYQILQYAIFSCRFYKKKRTFG